MDFRKLMTISMEDVGDVEQAENLYRQADEILEKLGYTKKEHQVASELVALRQKAIGDVASIVETYVFPEGSDVIYLDKKDYYVEKLTKADDVITWHSDFLGIVDCENTWHGKVIITVNELFELYKAEYLYEYHKDHIPRDFMAYYKRCYSLAGAFQIFARGANVN